MSRPNLFIVGAPKCGTTAWYEYLRSHPDIYFPQVKEPHYFCTDFPNFRWAKTEDEFLTYFAEAPATGIIGEASVQYLYSTEAAANIADFAPGARIIIFLREPGKFLQSYHNQLLLNLDENVADFAAAWRASADMQSRQIPDSCREPRFLDYRSVGRFGEQVARYIDIFPASQVLLVDFQQWTSDPRAAYLNILAFLELKDDGRDDFPRINQAQSVVSPKIARLTRRAPPWALSIARLLRRLSGRERLGLAKRIRRVNQRPKESVELSAELAKELEAYFAEDQRYLRKLDATIRAARGH